MRWSTVLLVAFCIGGVNSMCFREENSELKTSTLHYTKVVDEHHCKMQCAAADDCSSYTYTVDDNNNLCGRMLGEIAQNSLAVQPTPTHWVKYTAELDCQDAIDIAELPIESLYDNYGINPTLAQRAVQTPMIHDEFEFNPCPLGSILDIVRASAPNKVHDVYGNGASWVLWDKKVGGWNFIKQTTKLNIKSNKTTYILAARCFEIEPEEFAGTISCGGSLPTRETVTSTYKRIGEVDKYGVTNYCPNPNNNQDTLLQVYTDISVDEPKTRETSSTRVICVDGSWILVNGKETPSYTERITEGTCVEYA